MLDLIWLIPFFPVAGVLVNGLFYRRMPKKAAGLLACAMVLCSLLVAQKVWDDRYLSNADFAFIYSFFVIEEINRLEKKFLELKPEEQ